MTIYDCKNCKHRLEPAGSELCEKCTPGTGSDNFEWSHDVDADVKALVTAMRKSYQEIPARNDGPSCSLMDKCKWSHSMGIEEPCYKCADGCNFIPYEEDEDMDEMDKVIELNEPKASNLTESEVIAKHTCQGCGVNKGDRHEIDCPLIKQEAMFPVVEQKVQPTPAQIKPPVKSQSVVEQVDGNHYVKGKKVETWDLYEQALTDDEFRGAMKNNIIKYLLRYRDKNGVVDLKKARSYIERLIEFEKGRRMVSTPINIHVAADDDYSAGELVTLFAKSINELLKKVVA